MVSNRPVYDVETMQMLESAQQFGAIEPTSALIEFAFALEMIEKLPAVDYAARTRTPISFVAYCQLGGTTHRRT